MKSNAMVMTVLGPDRPGLVEALADLVKQHHGSWQESRLTRVQDQFAGLISFDLPADAGADFEKDLEQVQQRLSLRCQLSGGELKPSKGKKVRLECLGQDRPGIVLALTDILADLEINVETMDTCLQNAPMSGEILFRAELDVSLPEHADLEVLQSRLSKIGEEMMLDVQMDK